MADRSLEPASGLPADFSLEGEVTGLERRVQRLEEAVAALQDTTLMEERLLERLGERAQVKVGPAVPVDERITSEKSAPAAAAPDVPPREHILPPPLSGLAEFRAMVRMFFDMHYHIAWTTRVLVIVFIGLIWTSEWWFLPAYVPVVGVILDKTFDIILAFLLYRVLAAEARRYVEYQAQRRFL